MNTTSDWINSSLVPGAHGDSLNSLRKGEGRILRINGKTVAAYRDNQGQVILCSPIYTHLQSIVDWNTTEQTGDGPHHDTRFDGTGEVLGGPAGADLENFVGSSQRASS